MMKRRFISLLLGVLIIIVSAVFAGLLFVTKSGGTKSVSSAGLNAEYETAPALSEQKQVTEYYLEGRISEIEAAGAASRMASGSGSPGETTAGRETAGIGAAETSAAVIGSERTDLSDSGPGGSATDAPGAYAAGDYILPESNTRFYTEAELSVLTKEQLSLARNEIYARLGRKFRNEELSAYFGGKQWYHPLHEPDVFDAKGDSAFNPYELANRNLILKIEEKLN